MAAVSVRSSPVPPESKPSLSDHQNQGQGQGQGGYATNGPPPAQQHGMNGANPFLSHGPDRLDGNAHANGASQARRSTSPVKMDKPPSAVVPKHDRPIDMRAEEDAARRLNVGRVAGNSRYSGSEARGKKTELFTLEFRKRLEQSARNYQTAFDEEALAYLSMAAETRLRQVFSSAVSAQQHRTTTDYYHTPPIAAGGSKGGKAMWEVSVSSDPNAVLEVMNKQSKEAEREFRTSRMNRLAKEHEMERLREKQAAANGDGSGDQAGGAGVGMGGGQSSSSITSATGPDTPINMGNFNGNGDTASSTSDQQHQPSSSPPRSHSRQDSANSTPTFGGPKKAKTQSRKPTKDVSADVQIKMSNATAMRSAGMGKKYSWMSSAPNISSPLSGNKKKGKKGKVDADAEGEARVAGEAGGSGEADAEQGSKKRKTTNGSTSTSGGGGGDDGKSRSSTRRRLPKGQNRRMVSVAPGPPPLNLDGSANPPKQSAEGGGKMIPDDRCLTVNDLVFALDRDKKGGQGMGTSDEIVRRVMARPGGPWGTGSLDRDRDRDSRGRAM